MIERSTDADEVAAGITRISELVMSEQTVQSVLDLIVGLVRETIGAVDDVSVTVRRSHRLVTVAHTSSDVADLDAMQYKRELGPCVHALRTGEEVLMEDLRADERWPDFAMKARDLGFASVLAIPLQPIDEPIGVLNLYSRTARSFTEEQRTMARSLAHQAAIGFANSGSFYQSEEANEQLREALVSRDVIGQAKGIIMQRDDVSADEAFDQMRAESQRSQRKLRDVADEIIENVTDRSNQDG